MCHNLEKWNLCYSTTAVKGDKSNVAPLRQAEAAAAFLLPQQYRNGDESDRELERATLYFCLSLYVTCQSEIFSWPWYEISPVRLWSDRSCPSDHLGLGRRLTDGEAASGRPSRCLGVKSFWNYATALARQEASFSVRIQAQVKTTVTKLTGRLRKIAAMATRIYFCRWVQLFCGSHLWT